MLVILSGRERWRLSEVYILLDFVVGFTDTELTSRHKQVFDHARMERQKLTFYHIDGVKRACKNFKRCAVIAVLLLHERQSNHLTIWVR
jgi:hypothetical protein